MKISTYIGISLALTILTIGFFRVARADPLPACGSSLGYAGSTFQNVTYSYQDTGWLQVHYDVVNYQYRFFNFQFAARDSNCDPDLGSSEPYAQVMSYYGPAFSMGGTPGHSYTIKLIHISNITGQDTIELWDETTGEKMAESNPNRGVTFNPNGYCSLAPSDGWSEAFGTPFLPCKSTPTTPPNLTIETPINGSYITAGIGTDILGDCPINGTGRLLLTDAPFQARQQPDSSYNINCTNNIWSSSFKPKTGDNLIFIVDKQAKIDNLVDLSNHQVFRNITYTGISNTGYSLSLVYPEQSASNIFEVKPSSAFPIRFRISIPDRKVIKDSDLLKPSYKIQEYSDYLRQDPITGVSCPTFIGCTGYLGQQFGNDGNGLVSGTINISDGSTRYFRIYLYDGDGSGIKYLLNFTIKGIEAPGSIDSIPPDEQDLGYWGNLARALFVPPSDAMGLELSDLQDNFQSRVPFSYFYQVKNNFIDVSTSTQSGYFINTTLAISSPNGIQNIPFQFMNTGDPVNRNIFDTFRPFISAGLWIAFAMYLLNRGHRLFNKV